MSSTILPNGEELKVTPDEILKYLNPDGLRQLLRQERLRWNLKPNRDSDYYDNQHLFKYTGELHNNAEYQKIEIKTYPDNGAYFGYAGLFNDSGVYGIPHNLDQWDHSISDESKKAIVNRTMIGAAANIPEKSGYGLGESGDMELNTNNRMSGILFDPYDGRAYLYSNDDPNYVNNETRSKNTKIPDRAIARMGDIPTRIAQLRNDLSFISDPEYRHTDNNFTNSNRYMLDNLDDRTFVYPEISKDKSGDYIINRRTGLNGLPGYAESDGINKINTQPDLGINPDLGDFGDRFGEAVSSYNHNSRFSGIDHEPGYLPGIFRSIEELERVDLVDQLRTSNTHQSTPGSRRLMNYYSFDGKWSSNWFDREVYNDSYLAQSINPNNMELHVSGREPIPFCKLDQPDENKYTTDKLYQWRYNRVELKYYAKDIRIEIVKSGQQYEVNDILTWVFGNDIFKYQVTQVGPNGQIQAGIFTIPENHVYDQDPSTHGVGIRFTNKSSVGHGARLQIISKVTIETHATQIKNNLYAYVDITPTVRSDNSTQWSDINEPDSSNGQVVIRSTAAGPGYTGINSGRGGPSPTVNSTKNTFYEHGGNATAGVHVHLFRYVINTQNPTWVIRNGIQVFTGRWVDQGPMGVERPCDIKALYLSNFDTNNFNNYYKFMVDSLFDTMNRTPDSVISNNRNATSNAYLHIDQIDPEPDQRFTETRLDPDTSKLVDVDITDRVIYINAATGVTFMYNSSYKNDPAFGYGSRAPGWFALAGATTR